MSGGNHKLEGLYVKSHNFGAPNLTAPEVLNANDFNYSSGDDRFEWVNVYYHVDTVQRYIQSLGITTANNRQTECDAHDNSVNAAWYSPIDRGRTSAIPVHADPIAAKMDTSCCMNTAMPFRITRCQVGAGQSRDRQRRNARHG